MNGSTGPGRRRGLRDGLRTRHLGAERDAYGNSKNIRPRRQEVKSFFFKNLGGRNV